ncbi:MAG TPA: hypothetical protein VK084_04260 [Chitinophagaceae bacterium]|nr:hypothetical protein [Chitinophagaceae bacterium]
MKRILTVILFLGLAQLAFSQDSNQEDIKNVEFQQIHFLGNMEANHYENEFDVGGRLNTDGWSVYLELEKKKNEKFWNLYHFEVGEIKSLKESKESRILQSNRYRIGRGRRYVYGKKNIFYQIRFGYGQRRIIGHKGNQHGVEVSAIYMAGVSLGLMRPYYLQLLDSSGQSYYAKYTPESSADFLNRNAILQSGGMKYGWDELKVIPGFYARLGMRFDWAQYNKFVSALEVGVIGTYYTKDAQIMVKEDGKNFFYGAYISLLFGKRWKISN